MSLFVVLNALLVSQKNAGTAGFFSNGRELLMIPKVKKLAPSEGSTPLFIHQLGSVWAPWCWIAHLTDCLPQRSLCIYLCVHTGINLCIKED